jgi:siroheme synthase (precorrin-2 oxidase/ferrochelatase)
MANTKLRYLRCDDMWDKAMAKAHSQDISLSERIRDFLEDYVNANDEPLSTRDELLQIRNRINSIRRKRHRIFVKANDKKVSVSKRLLRDLLEDYVNNELLQINEHLKSTCKRLEEIEIEQ